MWKSSWIKLLLPVGSMGKHCCGGTNMGEELGPSRKNDSVNFSISFLKFPEGNQCRSRSAKKNANDCCLVLTALTAAQDGRVTEPRLPRRDAFFQRNPTSQTLSNKYVSSKTIKQYGSYRPIDMR